MLSIDVELTDSFYKKIGHSKEYENALDKAIDHATQEAENTCRREAPYKTGNLRRSINKNKPGKCAGEIKSRAHYWVYLQYGTSKINANPFVTRTAKKVSPKLQKYFAEELNSLGVL